MNRRALIFAACAVAVILVVLGAFLRSSRSRDQLDAGVRSSSPAVASPTSLTSPETAPASPVEPSAATSRVPIVAESASAASIEDGRLRILIAAEDGTLIANAQVVLFSEQRFLDLAVSDAQGRVRFAANSFGGEVAVLAPGYPLLRQAIELVAGLRRITLPEGEQLSGLIDVDGSTPREPIDLLWLADFKPFAAIEQLPASVRELLRDRLKLQGCPQATTDAQGAFAFHGLEHGASGNLGWDGPYWIVDESTASERRNLHLSTPERNLRLHFREGLELRLRVVDSSAVPVPRAKVELVTVTKGEVGNDTSRAMKVADDEGRARFAIQRNLPNLLQVVVALPDGGGSTSHIIQLPGTARGAWDVGDLAIQPTRALAVRVENSEGQPVESASVMPLPSVTGLDGVNTDANGKCQLALALDVKKIAVHAKGYDLVQVAAPPNIGELLVVLEIQSQIEFVIAGFDGTERDLSVVISGVPPLLARTAPDDRADNGRASLGVKAPGRCLTPALTPNNPLHAQLRYRSGHVLATAEIPGLAVGEHRRVELMVSAQPLKFRVLVRNENGEPVANARVILKYPRGGSSKGDPVDAAGEISVGPIYAQPFTVVAQAPGLAPKALFGVTIPPEEITIVLEAPRRVELELQNPDGSRFVGKTEVFVATNGGGDGTCTSNGEGHWTLDGLPRGEIWIYVEGDFGELTVLHEATTPKRVLVVGEPGSVSVSANSAGDHETQEWAVALADAGSSQPLTRTRFFFDSAGHEETVFQGLPLRAYDVWLETRETSPGGQWTRVSSPASAKLDADHPHAALELKH